MSGADPAGRVALVVGGTRGIGLATARAFAAEGARVVLTGRDGDEARDAARRIDGAAAGYPLDVTDFGAVAPFVETVAREAGRLDALVASAGVLENAPLGLIRADHVQRVFATNVFGAVACVQAAARVMLRRRTGAIVLLSSVVGRSGSPGQAVYAAAKAAVASLARSAARELGPRGIRVNAVAPGVIDTDLTAALPDEVRRRHAAGAALRRLGTADEVARTICFLAGDGARYITGQVVAVDGGMAW